MSETSIGAARLPGWSIEGCRERIATKLWMSGHTLPWTRSSGLDCRLYTAQTHDHGTLRCVAASVGGMDMQVVGDSVQRCTGDMYQWRRSLHDALLTRPAPVLWRRMRCRARKSRGVCACACCVCFCFSRSSLPAQLDTPRYQALGVPSTPYVAHLPSATNLSSERGDATHTKRNTSTTDARNPSGPSSASDPNRRVVISLQAVA